MIFLHPTLCWLRQRLIFGQEINELQSGWSGGCSRGEGPFVTLRLNPLTDDPAVVNYEKF